MNMENILGKGKLKIEKNGDKNFSSKKVTACKFDLKKFNPF